LLRLVAVLKPVDAGDLDRYEVLARAMLAGRGYAFTAEEAAVYLGQAKATPVTELPPGYAAVVAAHYVIWEDPRGLLISNWLMSTLSILLLYGAVRPWGTKPATIAAGLLACNPWVIRWTGHYFTETCGLFLMSASLWCLSRLDAQTRGWLWAFWLGVFSSGLVLTTPGVMFVTGGLLIYGMWQHRSRPVLICAMLAGVAVCMGPWQVHCYRATGHVVPTVLTPSRATNTVSYFHSWVNTWMARASQIAVYWRPGPYMDEIPADVFFDAAEKETLRKAAQGFVDKQVSVDEYNETFRHPYERRLAEVPAWRRNLLLPTLRGITLWTEHQKLIWTSGWKATLVDGVFGLLNYFYLFCFTGFALAGLRRSPLLVLVVIGGTIGYTAVCGIWGATEYRRNYPLIPALLFLAGPSMRVREGRRT
jgi:4-amino-4-deoxy-L-arabinose transferase-like glycosyltransferase